MITKEKFEKLVAATSENASAWTMAATIVVENARADLRHMTEGELAGMIQNGISNLVMPEQVPAIAHMGKELAELEPMELLYFIQQCAPEVIRPSSFTWNVDEEGICPVCGASIEYTGDDDIDDDGGKHSWTCPKCGASGEEGYNAVFDRHYNVVDANEEEIPGRPE